jgi:hypothetical protein
MALFGWMATTATPARDSLQRFVDPGFVQLCGRAMVAGENDDQYFACIVVKTMPLAVDTGEAEVRARKHQGIEQEVRLVAKGGTLE